MNFKRISKPQARKLYESYKPFMICACNLRPELFGIPIDASSIEYDTDFETLVNNFYAYNCINAETGRRVAFYTEG